MANKNTFILLNMSWNCTHATCNKIRAERNLRTGVGIALLMNVNDVNKHSIAVGRERFGEHVGEFNICAGKAERKDYDSQNKLCYCRLARRELEEEFKLCGPRPGSWVAFDELFGKPIKFIMVNGTPVFIGELPWDTNIDVLRKRIYQDNCNFGNGLNYDPYAEMDDFQMVHLNARDTRLEIRRPRWIPPLTAFTNRVIEELVRSGY
jgi:hypothetical protein